MSEKKSGPGFSNRNIVYRCTACGKVKDRDDLLAKRTTFSTLKPVKLVRSRVVAWVCSDCRNVDPAWTSAPFVDSPGLADVKVD